MLFAMASAAAQQAVPRPVHGISLDEWASASARLSAGRPLAPILALLEVTEAQWNEADANFTAALDATPHGDVIQHYEIVFANPNSGRFAIAADAPRRLEIFVFEDYARVQAEVTAAREAGQDVAALLRNRFGLSPFAWSQQQKQWRGFLDDLVRSDPARARQLRAGADAALAEARARVGGPGRQP